MKWSQRKEEEKIRDDCRSFRRDLNTTSRTAVVYLYRQLLCPTAAITSTKFIQHSIYVDSIENKAIIEKLIIIQIKNNIYICKKNTADQWLGHLTRKKDLLQARRARHTTDHVGLWFAQLSTPRGSDFTAQYFCPDAGNFTGFQVAGFHQPCCCKTLNLPVDPISKFLHEHIFGT